MDYGKLESENEKFAFYKNEQFWFYFGSKKEKQTCMNVKFHVGLLFLECVGDMNIFEGTIYSILSGTVVEQVKDKSKAFEENFENY